MILVVGGIKGGSGKTTLATNLVVMRSLMGRKVLLVDADEQKSTKKWNEHRQAKGIESPWTFVQLEGKTLHVQIEKLKSNYDDIIIDVGGRDTSSQRSALIVSDIFLTPFKPCSIDIWTLEELNEMIERVSLANQNMKTFAVINQAFPIGNDHKDAIDVISECTHINCIPSPVRSRKAFSNSFSEGLGVVEMKNADKKAVDEMNSLFEFIYAN